MKRVLLAGVVGVVVAAVAFAVVVALTDVRVTTSGSPTSTTTSTVGGLAIAGRTPPPCPSGASLSYGFHLPQAAAGALMVPVRISLAKGTPCTLDADANFEIQSLDVRGSIDGNPQSWHVHGAIDEETGPSSIFVWRNYCGPGEARFAFKLSVKGHGSARLSDQNRAPSCEVPGPGAESTLDRLPISG